MKKEHSKLMDKVLQSLDWDSILEINKVLKLGTGTGNEIIPGVKKKPFGDSLTKNDFKNELKALLKYAIENHVPQLSYGNWIIYWISDDWDVDLHYPEEMDDEEIDELDPEEFNFVMEPRIEVIFSPQRINLVGEISQPEGATKEFVNLEEMLEKAIKNEEYELATKIRDLISQNKEKKLDK
jgi:hypothetical protein